MNKENTEKTVSVEQPSTQAPMTPAPSDNLMVIKRPRPGSVVILAPPGTPISVSGTEEYEKVVLLEVPGE
jgi:hypothetical protein